MSVEQNPVISSDKSHQPGIAEGVLPLDSIIQSQEPPIHKRTPAHAREPRYSAGQRLAASFALLGSLSILASDGYDTTRQHRVLPAVVSVGIAAAEGVAASDAELQMQGDNAQTQEAAGIAQAERKTREIIAAGPGEFDPRLYVAGEALGAFVIEYAPSKTVDLSAADLATCKAGQALEESKMAACFGVLRENYFASIGQANPQVDPISVHRFTAGGDGSTVNDYLANGPVVHSNSNSGMTVIGLHTITPIENAPVAYNGKTYDQTLMGINSFIPKGSVIKLVIPSSIPGYVEEHTYEREDFSIIDFATNPDAAAQAVYAPDASGKTTLRVYECWSPGDFDKRLVYSFVSMSDKYVLGSVSQVGDTLVTAPQVG